MHAVLPARWMATRIGKRGTVVIPAPFRREFGLEEGASVIVEARDGGIFLKPAAVDLLSDGERHELLEGANRAYAAVKMNPRAWAEEQRARTAWQNTAGAALPLGIRSEIWTDDDYVPRD